MAQIWDIGHELIMQEEYGRHFKHAAQIDAALEAGFPLKVYINGDKNFRPFPLMEAGLFCSSYGVTNHNDHLVKNWCKFCPQCFAWRKDAFIEDHIKYYKMDKEWEDFEAKFLDYPGPPRRVMLELMSKVPLFDP